VPEGVFRIRSFPEADRIVMNLKNGSLAVYADLDRLAVVAQSNRCCPGAVALSPDGARLVAAYSHGGLKIWALDTASRRPKSLGTLFALAHVDAGYVLTNDGRFALLGADSDAARSTLRCGIGRYSLPLQACAARYQLPVTADGVKTPGSRGCAWCMPARIDSAWQAELGLPRSRIVK
jgi:hypothetical protein